MQYLHKYSLHTYLFFLKKIINRFTLNLTLKSSLIHFHDKYLRFFPKIHFANMNKEYSIKRTTISKKKNFRI